MCVGKGFKQGVGRVDVFNNANYLLIMTQFCPILVQHGSCACLESTACCGCTATSCLRSHAKLSCMQVL